MTNLQTRKKYTQTEKVLTENPLIASSCGLQSRSSLKALMKGKI